MPNHATPSTKTHSPSPIIPAIITLAAFALRCYRLGVPSIWYDEGVSIYLARQSLAELIAHTAGDIHPPGYYALLHVWIRAAGDSELAVAFLSLVFGVLLVPLIYALGRRLYGPAAGRWAALLVALSPYNLQYSQEMRMYTLGAFLGLLTLWCMVGWLSDTKPLRRFGSNIHSESALAGQELPHRQEHWQPSQGWLFGYTLAAALGLYTLYYFAFLLVFENLFVLGWWLWSARLPKSSETSEVWAKGPGIGRWIAAQVGVAILYAPWIPIAYRQATNPPVPPWRNFASLWSVLTESWTALSLGQTVEPGTVWPVLLLLAAVYGLGLLAARPTPRAPKPTPILLAGYTFAPLALIYLLSLALPLYHVRYVFTYSPAFYLVLGAGLAWLGRRRRAAPWLAMAVVAAASAYAIHNFHFDPRYADDDHRTAVRFIADRWRPGDAVLINAGYVYPTFVYYYDGPIAWRGRLVDYHGQGRDGQGAVVVQTGTIGGDPDLGWGNPNSDFYPTTEEETAAALGRLFADHPRLWVLRCYDTVTDPGGFIRAWLDEHGRKFEEMTVTGGSNMRVQGYLTRPAPVFEPPPLAHAIGADLGGKMTLLGYDGETTGAVAGEPIDLALYWQPTAQPAVDYHVTLGLFDAQQRPWAQTNERPLGSLYPSSRWPAGAVIRHPLRLWVPVGTPPGEYTLQVGMYDPRVGQTLAVAAPWGVQGVRVALATIRLTRPATPPPAPPMRHRAGADFGGQLRLLGYSVFPTAIKPGNELAVDLYWRSLAPSLDDYVISLQLRDEGGQLRAIRESPPVDGRYPTPGWAQGEIVHDPHRLALPASLPPGTYRLSLAVYRRGDAEARLPLRGLLTTREAFEMGTITVESRPATFQRPANIQHPLLARLGSSVELVGYSLSDERPQPGQKVELTLYWQATALVEGNYKVFTHLVGEGEQIVAQHDSIPAGGRLPTSAWQKGEYITDRHPLTVPADVPPGVYRLQIGLYDEANGQRLPVFDEEGQPIGDRVLLGSIRVGE